MTAPQITIHDATGIAVTNVRHAILPDGVEYYSRLLTVMGADGAILTVQMFSDDGYALLVHDSDLRQIQEPIEAD